MLWFKDALACLSTSILSNIQLSTLIRTFKAIEWQIHFSFKLRWGIICAIFAPTQILLQDKACFLTAMWLNIQSLIRKGRLIGPVGLCAYLRYAPLHKSRFFMWFHTFFAEYEDGGDWRINTVALLLLTMNELAIYIPKWHLFLVSDACSTFSKSSAGLCGLMKRRSNHVLPSSMQVLWDIGQNAWLTNIHYSGS